MADSEVTNKEDSSDAAVTEALKQTAEDEVAKAMEGAMANLPVPGEGDGKEQSDFQKKNLSYEKQEELIEYVEPMQDPYGKAIKYLEQHNVMQLFQQLTASIVYNKPEKPLEFMMTEVEKMKKAKEAEKETK